MNKLKSVFSKTTYYVAKLGVFAHLGLLVLLVIYLNHEMAKFLPNFKEFLLPDSDDVARVMEVRNWIDGQGFYDMLLHRANPPIGAQLHWSRLSDLPLASVELFLRNFYPHDIAEKQAVFFTPLILWGIAAIILGLTAQELFKSKLSYIFGIAYVILTDAVVVDYNAGRVDHHGLQLITLYLLFLGLFKTDKNGGIIAGLALAASLTIGFELIPMQIIMLVGFAIAWLLNPAARNEQLKYFALSFGLGIIAGFFINVAPQNYFIGDNDRLSIAQTLPILTGCIGLFLSSKYCEKSTTKRRFIALALVGISIIVVAAFFPVLRKPLYWQIAPIYYKLWMGDIGETFPTTKFPLPMQITILLFLYVAMLAGWVKQYLLWKNFDKDKNIEAIENWAILNIALFVANVLTTFYQVRIHLPAAGIALLVCAPLVAEAFRQKTWQKSLLQGSLIGIILCPAALMFAQKYVQSLAPKKEHKSEYSFGGRINCRAKRDFAHLDAMPKGFVLTNINMGAETMFQTHHDVMVTHFHRDYGREKVYDILLSKPDLAWQKLKANHVDYVAYCERAMEPTRAKQLAPDSLMGQLRQGKKFDFLEEIPRPSYSDIIAYKVKK